MKKLMRALSLVLVCVMLMPLIVGCQPVEDPDHKHAFIKMVATTEFLSEEGSCSKKSTYFYSCECGEKGTEVFEGDYAYDHVFDQKNTDSKYLKESGSCDTKSVYYYSCECGAKGTEFFEVSAGHDFTEKKTTYEFFASDSTSSSATKFYYTCKKCGEKSSQTFEYGKSDSQRATVGSKAKEMLDGKKILIAGCSYNYYGKIVMLKNSDVTAQSSRENDKGYFYELCKQNGANVSVTNWCFGNHDLTDLLGTSCAASGSCGNGFNHLAQLTDRNYDYVSLMDIARPNKVSLQQYISEMKKFMKIFTDVNPNCKFIYSIPCGAYWYKDKDRTDFKETYVGTVYAKEIAKLDNVIVMDWGKMIHDLLKGNAKVPNSSFTYNANSFIVGDGYHPNLLSGYINTLMTYCIITGETAVGQPINLENGLEDSTSSKFKKSKYVASFYGSRSTNFIDVLDSASEMANIQKLVNRYLDMQTYLYY